MNMFKKKTLAVATATALGLGMAGTAHAGAKAFSSLLIDNFQVFSVGTGNQLDVADFVPGSLTVQNESSSLADLASVAGTAASSVGPISGEPDALLSCQGPSCDDPDGDGVIQNDFDQQTPVGSLHFARGDSRLLGAIISGTGASQDSVTANTVGEVQLTDDDSGRGEARVGTTSGFTFTLASADAVRLDFDATGLIDLLLNTGVLAGSAVSAEFAFGITLSGDENGDGTNETIFSWSPDGVGGTFPTGKAGTTEIADPCSLNAQLALTGPVPPNPSSDSFTCSGFFSAQTGTLLSGVAYNLRIQHSGNAAATKLTAVPEPATLALLGAGLIGLGATRQSKKAKA